MQISVQNIWKRYSTNWILKELNFEIPSGSHWAIKGLNGSGKSTLMQILSGYLSSTKGEVLYNNDGSEISRNEVFKYLAFNAAYSELDEELTVIELFEHFKQFKPYLVSDNKAFVEIADLKKEQHKTLNTFSSGMKQRLGLTLTVLMNTPLLLLDEPTSFLDRSRKVWFKELISSYCNNRTTIIASNDPDDFYTCTSELQI